MELLKDILYILWGMIVGFVQWLVIAGAFVALVVAGLYMLGGLGV